MKKAIFAALLVAAAAMPAQAATNVSTTSGNAVYAGPGFTPAASFDFDSATPRWDRLIYNDSPGGVRAQPLGSTGGYASVGPTDGTPGTFDLTGLGPVRRVSFIWGSVDNFNTLKCWAPNSVLATIVGNDVFNPANGNQSDPNTNPIVTLTFLDGTYGQVTGLRLNSTRNAFEIDNLAVGVPEPATWAMMIGGFGMLGFAARRRKTAKHVIA